MIEAALLVILASGLWVMANQINKRQQTALPVADENERRFLSVIAEGGLYRLASPHDIIRMKAFRELQLVEGGLALRDNTTQERHIIDFATIEWVSAITLPQDGIASISIHIEAKRHWRILTLQTPETDMSILVKVLRRALAPSRLNIGQLAAKPIGPLSAHIAEDTLQGETNIGAEVSLYLLPHMLIVLQGDVVQAKLDTSSIRRILSVERVSGRFDSFIHPNGYEGVVRLYSLYETVAFALPQFRELAEEIAYLAHCPVDFITQEDKTGKF